jgi:rod shape-determining protein MreD
MKKKLIYLFAVLYITLIIQTTLLDYIKIFDIKPNLILILIVCVTLIRGGIEGAVFGLAAGLFQDILSGNSIGPYALLGFIIGFGLGGFNKRFYRDNIFVCAIITFAVSIIYESIIILPGIPLSNYQLILQILKKDILTEALYNIVISIPFYIIILRLSDRIVSKEKSLNKY